MIIRFLTVGLLAPRPTRNLENHALSLLATARSLYKNLCLALELCFWKTKIRAKHLYPPLELFKATETLVFEVPVSCQRKALIRDSARFFQDLLGKFVKIEAQQLCSWCIRNYPLFLAAVSCNRKLRTCHAVVLRDNLTFHCILLNIHQSDKWVSIDVPRHRFIYVRFFKLVIVSIFLKPSALGHFLLHNKGRHLISA
jgi:hypothetical protein